MAVTGIHHVSSISGAAQATLDAYAGRLGLRLVKQTVNFDDPSTYHLYFADRDARPGSALTFFPWPDGQPGKAGAGQVQSVAYAVRPGALDGWLDRLAAAGDDGFDAPTEVLGERVLPVFDDWGLRYALTEVEGDHGAWSDGRIPEAEALGAFHTVTLDSRDPEATARVLTDAVGLATLAVTAAPGLPLGLRLAATATYGPGNARGDGRTRFAAPGADRARFVDLLDTPGPPARMGVGTVHHVALRVPDDAAELAIRERLLSMGLSPTPQIDRQYFRSVYTREPGGVLIELATDGPGFAVDEPADALGQRLMLPPHYEPRRARIEAHLPPLRRP